MAFDLFQSRRNLNERCRYWGVNESEEIELNELVYKRVADGMFYAKEVNSETENNNIISGLDMFERTTVTIFTTDDVKNIKRNDIVEYQEELWRVSDVQRKKARIQNSEFAAATNVSHYWYLTLKK